MGMTALLSDISRVRKAVGRAAGERMLEFSRNSDWFSEMCFCILTANYTAEGGIRIQDSIKDFSKPSLEELELSLRKLGHRFPRARAGYIFLAREHKDSIHLLRGMADSMERREWLVRNVKGLGYKEASHFLRNVGFSDVAIIDRHILAVLADYGLLPGFADRKPGIRMPKTLTRKRYLEIESVLKTVSDAAGVPLGELDLYMWYMKTGKVLK